MTQYENNLVKICKDYKILIAEGYITEDEAVDAIVECILNLSISEVAIEASLCLEK